MSMTNTANVATIKTAAVAPAPQHAGVQARGGMRRRFRVEVLTVHIALILICGGFLLPLIWMLSTSLKPLEQTTEFPPRFIPRQIVPGNYIDVMTSSEFRFAQF